jgi:ABC-type multidrug transport system fused ATPase/permease subunit
MTDKKPNTNIYLNKWFWIYIIVVTIGLYLLKQENTIVKSIAIACVIISQFIYNIKGELDSYLKRFYWTLFGFIFLVGTAYFTVNLNLIELAAILLGLSIIFVLSSFIFSYLKQLFDLSNSRKTNRKIKLVFVLIFYLLISIHIILLFSYMYSVLNSYEDHQITTEQIENTNFSHTLFYSGSIYYSLTFNYTPKGISRWITLIQSFVSFAIHIIYLGIIIASFSKYK